MRQYTGQHPARALWQLRHRSGAARAVLALRVKAHFCDLRSRSATSRSALHSFFFDFRSMLHSAHVTFRPAPLQFRSAHTNSLHQCKRKHNFTTFLYTVNVFTGHQHILMIAVGMVVCLSVCPSVCHTQTRWHCVKTTQAISRNLHRQIFQGL